MAETCQRHDLNWPTVARFLTALPGTILPCQGIALELMTLSELCDHLEHMHRVTIQDELTCLDQLTCTAVQELGAEHPQLLQIRATFVTFRETFAAHLREETEELFPMIRELTTGKQKRLVLPPALKSCLARMESEHNQADEALTELDALAEDKSLQRHAILVLRTACHDAIFRLKHAVHERIYEENQVLFPRTLAMGGFA